MPGNTPTDVLAQAVERLGLPSGSRVLLAVSGGPDSMALLDTMARLASLPEHGWELRVGHVNHQLRGDESDLDEEFVRSQARARGVPVDAVRLDTAAYARTHHLSLETAAREGRYVALFRLLQDWPGDALATGHTEDDQAETLLLRLLRGTGLAGLGGMPLRSGAVVRPWLGVRHETLLAALQERGQGYRIDSSNRDLRHRRNRVRSEVVPALSLIQPRAVELLARTAELLQEDADFLTAEAERACASLDVAQSVGEVSAARGAWAALHPALRRMTLRLLLRQCLGALHDLDRAHIEAVERSVLEGRPLTSQLPRGLTLAVNAERFTLRRGATPSPEPIPQVELAVPGCVTLPRGTLNAELITNLESADIARLAAVCGPQHALCDANRVGRRLVIRGRQPGDRVHPLGAPGSRKLQDVMVDRRVPAVHRDLLPVVSDAEGIIWVPGVVTAHRTAVTEATSEVLHLYYEPHRVKPAC